MGPLGASECLNPRGFYRQKKQFSAHSRGISFWQAGHIKPFWRIAWQVWQKSCRTCDLLFGSFMRVVTIWFISVNISAEFSIVASKFPLSLFTYLLTADCDRPSSCAVCCSFNPRFVTISLAMTALTAGRTVLTPTSHGSIKLGTK